MKLYQHLKSFFLCTETCRTVVRTALMDWTALSRMVLNKSCGDEKKFPPNDGFVKFSRNDWHFFCERRQLTS